MEEKYDLKFFLKGCIDEALVQLFINCTDMKTENDFQVTISDFKSQVENLIAVKIQFSEGFHGNPDRARIFMFLVRHRNITKIPVG